MLTAIAIISLVSFMLGILGESVSKTAPKPMLGLGSIMVISWWTISFPWAIVFLVILVIWFLICCVANSN